ncbi:MAG: spore coat protein [Bacilli bacterium]|nr:spore coat protein [Bacilli bacterium]
MKKIKNEKTEVTKNKKINDEDILNEILMNEKNMSNNYSIALDEMSNNNLFKEVMKLFNSSKNLAREAYNLAFKNGWYILTTADEKEITSAYDKNSKRLKEL